jgi:hypothetical protein
VRPSRSVSRCCGSKHKYQRDMVEPYSVPAEHDLEYIAMTTYRDAHFDVCAHVSREDPGLKHDDETTTYHDGYLAERPHEKELLLGVASVSGPSLRIRRVSINLMGLQVPRYRARCRAQLDLDRAFRGHLWLGRRACCWR